LPHLSFHLKFWYSKVVLDQKGRWCRTFFDRFFRRVSEHPKAVCFIDYEYWYYSYKNLYHILPNPVRWRDELKKSFDLVELFFFGAFEQPDLCTEMPKIRAVSNMIVSTDNQGHFHKKDMTDFIMLDHIYQYAMEDKGGSVYILFTGDGHFQAVTRFLRQKLHKEVVVYGIRGAFSRQLQETAARTVQLPADDEAIRGCYRLIIDNFSYLAEHPQKHVIPTFAGTAAAVARYTGVEEATIRTALQEMLDLGYLVRKDYRVEFNRIVKILAPDWEKLHDAGLWEYPQ
jgi:uncharacterized LabA/DUF88 family protein